MQGTESAKLDTRKIRSNKPSGVYILYIFILMGGKGCCIINAFINIVIIMKITIAFISKLLLLSYCELKKKKLLFVVVVDLIVRILFLSLTWTVQRTWKSRTCNTA
jgi:hypothetical protein